ncbi:sugar phosphate isomerase/epimerase family protein [Schumannella soli]|uniref:sugar phosphate isomerase/epimerase family protein n=1 Tax=Schumannella soli TaxID=2590779 RepID=UPI0015E84FD1|nr:sugar phosphate isomerase/epimerase [Schumannella soli]
MTAALSLNSNTYHGFGVDDAIAGAARNGLRLIELAAVEGYTEHLHSGMSDAELAPVLDALRGEGIRLVGISGSSDIVTAEGRARFVRNLDLARRVGAEYVVTGTGETHGDTTRIDDESAFAQRVRELATAAEERGLDLAIETHGANYATGAAVRRLLDHVGAANVGIAYDTGNTLFYAETDPVDDLRSVVSEVRSVHLKDKRGAPRDWDFPALGDGDLDLDALVRTLAPLRPGGVLPLSIEIEFGPEGPASLDEVDDALARSVRHASALLRSALDGGVR